jgi:hypothetical protein
MIIVISKLFNTLRGDNQLFSTTAIFPKYNLCGWSCFYLLHLRIETSWIELVNHLDKFLQSPWQNARAFLCKFYNFGCGRQNLACLGSELIHAQKDNYRIEIQDRFPFATIEAIPQQAYCFPLLASGVFFQDQRYTKKSGQP